MDDVILRRRRKLLLLYRPRWTKKSMKELDDIAKTPPPLDDNTNDDVDADGRKEDESDMASTARCISIDQPATD
jgi:hypothetical protein